MALPTSVFSGHFSRVFYTTRPLADTAITTTLATTLTEFETGASYAELPHVRNLPELAEQGELQTFPVFGERYAISLPTQRTVTPAIFSLNYLASDHATGSTLSALVANYKLTIVCIALSSVKFYSYSELATRPSARYYSWGSFIDRSLQPNLSDAIQARMTFLPRTPWQGPV